MLNSSNIILRPLHSEDLYKINVWRNDYELNKLTLGIRFPKSLDLDKSWLDRTLIDITNKNVFFGIVELKNMDFIGIIQLSNIDWISRVGDFGISIGDKKNTNKGYGKESMRLFFKYVFFDLNIRKINLRVISYNTNAIETYKALGFLQEGTLKSEVFYDNQYHDVVIMALFAENFK
jgi:RimJ/RimL family protein N-acetyltransferase